MDVFAAMMTPYSERERDQDGSLYPREVALVARDDYYWSLL